MMNFPQRRGSRTASPRTAASAATATGALLGVGVALLGAALLAAVRPAHAGDWPMLRGGMQRSGVADEKVAPPLSLLWRFTAAFQRENPNSPAIVGTTAYFAAGNAASGGGVVYAVDTNTGAQKWRYPSEGGLPGHIFQTAPLVDGGFVYVGASDGNLYVLRANDGGLAHTFRTRGPILSSPVIEGGTLFFGSNDDNLYALDPATGALRWRQNYKATDNITSAPLLADGRVIFTTADQFVYSIEQATGIFKWRVRLPSRFVDNAPVYADNTLYVPSGRSLFAFVPRSGNMRWQVPLPGDIVVPPVAEGGVVYVIDRDRKMWALRANNGREVWAQGVQLPYIAAAAPTISGDVIYIPTSRNVIMAVSREDGKLLWNYAIEPSSSRANVAAPTYTSISAPIAIANGSLYVLSDDGSLSSFRPDAPDSTGPLASKFFPRPGSIVNGRPPIPFAAEVTDPGSGLDENSVRLTLDGQPLDATWDPTRNLIYYATTPAAGVVQTTLANGRHTVTLTARDWRGNERRESWSFLVDTSLPDTVNREQQAPAAPRATRRGSATSTPTTSRPRTTTGRPQPGNRPPGGGQQPPRTGGRPGGGGTTPAPPPNAPPPPPPPGL
jgi:outer membrane protein assembly factor BamB